MKSLYFIFNKGGFHRYHLDDLDSFIPTFKTFKATNSIISHSEWSNFFVSFANWNLFTVPSPVNGTKPRFHSEHLSLLATLALCGEHIHSNGFNNQLYASDPKILSSVLTFDFCSRLQVLPASKICMPC